MYLINIKKVYFKYRININKSQIRMIMYIYNVTFALSNKAGLIKWSVNDSYDFQCIDHSYYNSKKIFIE